MMEEAHLKDDEQYGTSPMTQALPALRAWNALPVEERVKLSQLFVERQMLLREIEELLFDERS